MTIGKTCLLYYILILCLILGKSIVFQDLAGAVFLITDKLVRQSGTEEVEVAGKDVLALVDADDKFCCIPNPFLFYTPNLRILLVSSWRTDRADRSWLVQNVMDSEAVIVVVPWQREELLVAS